VSTVVESTAITVVSALQQVVSVVEVSASVLLVLQPTAKIEMKKIVKRVFISLCWVLLCVFDNYFRKMKVIVLKLQVYVSFQIKIFSQKRGQL
jgi:hypothetical protein